MQKLTNLQIINMHRWLRDGVTRQEIAKRLGVHRNTITSHAAGRVAYDLKLAIQIGPVYCSGKPGSPMQLASERIDYHQPLTIYQAAPLLPDQPSVSRVHKLIRDGVLRTTMSHGRLYTKIAWVRDAALSILPPGLYFRGSSLRVFLPEHEADRMIDMMKHKRVQSQSCRRIAYYRAPLVFGVARALDLPIRIPTYRVSIAVEVLDLVGVHVI